MKDQGFRPKLPQQGWVQSIPRRWQPWWGWRTVSNPGCRREKSLLVEPWVASNTWATRAGPIWTLNGCFGPTYTYTHTTWRIDRFNLNLKSIASGLNCIKCPVLSRGILPTIHPQCGMFLGGQPGLQEKRRKAKLQDDMLILIEFCQHGLHGYAKFGHGWWWITLLSPLSDGLWQEKSK